MTEPKHPLGSKLPAMYGPKAFNQRILWGERDPIYKPKNDSQRLAYLIEECGEVLAAAGKCLRWGLDGRNPEPGASKETNVEWLKREVADLKVAIELMEEGTL